MSRSTWGSLAFMAAIVIGCGWLAFRDVQRDQEARQHCTVTGGQVVEVHPAGWFCQR